MAEEQQTAGSLPKLVRDKIPELIVGDGRWPTVRTLGQAEFVDALRLKLREEAPEASAAETRPALIAELADVAGVVAALAGALGISHDEIERQREGRRGERGGFERRVLLEGVRVSRAD